MTAILAATADRWWRPDSPYLAGTECLPKEGNPVSWASGLCLTPAWVGSDGYRWVALVPAGESHSPALRAKGRLRLTIHDRIIGRAGRLGTDRPCLFPGLNGLTRSARPAPTGASMRSLTESEFRLPLAAGCGKMLPWTSAASFAISLPTAGTATSSCTCGGSTPGPLATVSPRPPCRRRCSRCSGARASSASTPTRPRPSTRSPAAGRGHRHRHGQRQDAVLQPAGRRGPAGRTPPRGRCTSSPPRPSPRTSYAVLTALGRRTRSCRGLLSPGRLRRRHARPQPHAHPLAAPPWC